MTTSGPSPQQIIFLNKIADELLIEFTISSLHELLKHSDQTQVYNYAKKMATEETLSSPLYKMVMADNKQGIEAVIVPLMMSQAALAHSYMNFDDAVEVEMREKGLVETLHDCPFKKARPEICLFMSHVGTEVWCQLADPELESLWTHHMTAGDPFCRLVIKKKATPYKDPDSLGKVVKKLSMIKLPDDQYAQFHKFLLANYWIGNTTCFKTLNGSKKTMEVLGPNANRIGRNFGSTLIEANMLPARDISVMGSFINMFGEGSGMQGSITSMAPGVFAKEITECPFKNAPPEVCKQFEALFNGMLEVTNPELAFRYDRMMTMGDKTCKWVISKR